MLIDGWLDGWCLLWADGMITIGMNQGGKGRGTMNGSHVLLVKGRAGGKAWVMVVCNGDRTWDVDHGFYVREWRWRPFGYRFRGNLVEGRSWEGEEFMMHTIRQPHLC